MHFLAAPLLIGTDLHTASPEAIAILGSVELIAVDQDALGFQGRVVAHGEADDSWQIYGKKMASGAVGALLLNRGTTPINMTLAVSDVWISAGTPVVFRDLWAEKDLGPATTNPAYTALVPSHGTVALMLTPTPHA